MPKRSTINNQLAKAETLLVLGLFSESLMGPWLAAQPWPRWVKILLKMAIIIGCFGPVLQLLERVIDGSLATTRAAATAASVRTRPANAAFKLPESSTSCGNAIGAVPRWITG